MYVYLFLHSRTRMFVEQDNFALTPVNKLVHNMFICVSLILQILLLNQVGFTKIIIKIIHNYRILHAQHMRGMMSSM